MCLMDTLKNPRLKFIGYYAGMHKNPIIPASVRFVIWNEQSKVSKDEKQTFIADGDKCANCDECKVWKIAKVNDSGRTSLMVST